MFVLYSIVYTLALLVLLPFEYFKRGKQIRDTWLREKFGKPSINKLHSKIIWLHAVSVGEVAASVPFINKFLELNPGYRFIVSTITDTGRKIAQERLKGKADVIYMPFDLKFALKRAIYAVNPCAFLIVETEIWPNAVRTFKSLGVPIVFLNGRISEKSYLGYLKIRFFIKRVLRCASLFCMQDEVYAKRIQALGADRIKIINTGSMKFDIKVIDKEIKWAGMIGSPLIVAGSTHSGEDALIINAYSRLKGVIPGLGLIIAPRHPDRAGEVVQEIKKAGLNYMLRSEMYENLTQREIVVLDTVGELSSVYKAADIAVIGGSFIKHGGQNFLEPLYWGKPVVCGPYMFNFPYFREFYSIGAAIQADKDNLYEILRGLLLAPEKRVEMGMAGRNFIEKNRGAVDKAVAEVMNVLK